MLTSRNTSEKSRVLKILLFFISFITFHSMVLAGMKQETAEGYRLKGYMAQQKGNFNEALSNYTKAITLGLENATVLNDMGVLYEQFGMLKRAEQYYRKAIATDADYLPAYTNVAYLYKEQGWEEKAFGYFKKRYEMANPGDLWAEKIKEELLKIHPEYKEYIISIEAKRLDQEIVTKAHKQFYERVKLASEHYKQGISHMEEKRYQQALFELNLALQLTPGNPKIIEARKEIILELSKENIKKSSDQAIQMLNAGDSISAKNEIQKLLTTIPNGPIPISQ